MMRAIQSALVLTAFVSLAACKQEAQAPAADLAFLDDLQTELKMEQASAQKVVSPVELGTAALAGETETAEPEAAAAPQRSASTPARRSSSSSSSARRSSSGSSSGAVSAPAPARQPRVVEVKHTKRDAAIGAVAGAAIGAVAGGSQNRVKGAVIGGVLGGVAGAVIGNNVDKSTRVEY